MKIEPPDWLGDEAKIIFLETLELLGKSAVESDLSVLCDFAEAQADVIRLTAVVRFEGDTCIGKGNIPFMNPSLMILSARRTALERLRHDLKLTPRGRQAVLAKTSKSSVRDLLGS